MHDEYKTDARQGRKLRPRQLFERKGLFNKFFEIQNKVSCDFWFNSNYIIELTWFNIHCLNRITLVRCTLNYNYICPDK